MHFKSLQNVTWNLIFYKIILVRKNLVYELIRNDIFNIEASDKFDFINDLLNSNHAALKHAVTSLVSVISSTLKGVEYLIHNNNPSIM